jgi:diaminopimelate decarboxylase
MSTPAPRHCALPWFPVQGEHLVIGGETVSRLAARVGTPFYAYDRGVVDQHVQQLRAALPAAIKLHYALKANPMPALARHLAVLVDGCDIASQGELRVALEAGFSARHISFTGPGKGDDELRAALEAGVIINLESGPELVRLVRVATETGIRPRVTLRVNPDFELKSSGLRMGGGARQFGVDAEAAPRVLQQIRALDLDFLGLHVFSGSQSLNAQAIAQTQTATLQLALRLAQHAPGPLRLLNLGGGFGIPYFPGEQPLDLAPIAANLQELCAQAARELPGAELVLELGRYLVGEAGLYVCRVLERKVSRGQVFLITDGGLHQHLAASGNFGQVIRKNYPVLIGNRMQAPETETVSIVGRLCTPLDLLADRMELPRADAGDLVVILQSGAYGLSASPTRFLSHPAPAEILL